MKRIFIVFMLLAGVSSASWADGVSKFMLRETAQYPMSRLQDLYKSLYQNVMGAEHLIANSESAKAYLQKELTETSAEDMMQWYYEPCGTDSAFYRVSLRAVKEKVLTEEQLLSAFLRSNKKINAEQRGRLIREWKKLTDCIESYGIALPHYAADKARIDSIVRTESYATSHSKEYREAYNPHYRIVARDIFEAELKPVLEKYQKADGNGYIVFEGDVAPDFSVALTDGTVVRLSDLRGKVVMLQFTASWCSVCRKEMPFIERDIWQKHKDDADFVLIGIDRDEPLQKVVRFAETTGVTYPLGLDPGADIYAKFALRESGITRNVLIDRDGRIIMRTRLFNAEEFSALVDTINRELKK